MAVLLGEKATNALNRTLMVLFYAVSLGLVLTGLASAWVLIVALSLPRLVRVWRIYSKPRPASPPENYAVWPLWFVSWAFYWTKQAGTLFVLGVVLGAVVPIRLGG